MKNLTVRRSSNLPFVPMTLLGCALLLGNVLGVSGQTPTTTGGSAFERCSKLLKYGRIHGASEPTKVDAVHALGLLGDERAVPLLIEHLENEENDNLRLQIVRALGWIGSESAVPALEKALADKYPYVRQQAAIALKKITGKDNEFDRTGLPDSSKLRELLEKAQSDRKG